MVPFRSPLGLLPAPGEVHVATLFTWAGHWEWLFPRPTCSPVGSEAPSLVLPFPGLRLAQGESHV